MGICCFSFYPFRCNKTPKSKCCSHLCSTRISSWGYGQRAMKTWLCFPNWNNRKRATLGRAYMGIGENNKQTNSLALRCQAVLGTQVVRKTVCIVINWTIWSAAAETITDRKPLALLVVSERSPHSSHHHPFGWCWKKACVFRMWKICLGNTDPNKMAKYDYVTEILGYLPHQVSF